MEVHAHTHTERKRFKHYLWEFIMLFLAVFCGFLAEYQLEHVIEHKREKQYIQSLSEDLRSDIKQIQDISVKFSAKIADLDTIIEGIGASPSLNCLKKLYRAIGFPDFVYTDRTIQQLKNSGGMRLIRNLPIADSIVGYDIHVRADLIHQEVMNTQVMPKLLEKLNDVMDVSEWLKLDRNNYTDSNRIKEAIFIVKDKNEMIRLKNELIGDRFQFITQLNKLTVIKENANRLLFLLQKEYHLK